MSLNTVAPADINVSLLTQTDRSSFCEWKGTASYYSVSLPGKEVRDRCSSYGNPTTGFNPIKDYISFNAGPWGCFLDGEKVVPQPGDF